MRSSKTFFVLAIITLSMTACIHDPWRKDAATRTTPSIRQVAAAGFVAHALRTDPHAPVRDRAKARNACFDVAYRYYVDLGMSKVGASKYANAFADDKPAPEITCADYANAPPSDCHNVPQTRKEHQP